MTFTNLTQTTSDDALLRLPFDQYGRYRMVQQAVAAISAALAMPRLSILDVGGYYQEADGTPRLPSQQFLGDHDLTVLDLPPCELPGYVQGDGTAMTFDDSSFDLVISCDTLEHIPPELRDRFVGELVRVARFGVLLICPIDSYATALAEKVLYAYIQAELHAKHDQLREHREYGLPQLPLVQHAFAQSGCAVREYPSGDLHAWLPMMLAKHYLLRFAESQPELQYGLDELYNRSYGLEERRAPSYRRLVVACKEDPQSLPDEQERRPMGASLLAAVEDVLEPTVARTEEIDPAAWHGLAAQVLTLLQIGQDDRREEWRAQMLQTYIEGQRNHVSNLDRIIADQQMHTTQLQQALAATQQHVNLIQQRRDEREGQIEAHIADLEGRARWLEQQAVAARREVETMQNGVVMRLLRRLGR